MSTYDYIKGSCLQTLLNVGYLLRCPQTADIVHIARKVLETVLECLEMLKGKNGGRNKNSHLLAVGNCLERSPDSHFRLSESYISAHKPVHRTIILHIPLYGIYGLLLVRSVLIHERRLKLLLEIGVSRKGKSSRTLSLCVQLNEILRYVLDLGFCA